MPSFEGSLHIDACVCVGGGLFLCLKHREMLEFRDENEHREIVMKGNTGE